MQLLNTVFINTDIQHDCGHVIPATLEIVGGETEIKVSSDSLRVTMDVFFTTRRAVRFFAEGGRIHRLIDCPACGARLPIGF